MSTGEGRPRLRARRPSRALAALKERTESSRLLGGEAETQRGPSDHGRSAGDVGPQHVTALSARLDTEPPQSRPLVQKQLEQAQSPAESLPRWPIG